MCQENTSVGKFVWRWVTYDPQSRKSLIIIKILVICHKIIIRKIFTSLLLLKISIWPWPITPFTSNRFIKTTMLLLSHSICLEKIIWYFISSVHYLHIYIKLESSFTYKLSTGLLSDTPHWHIFPFVKKCLFFSFSYFVWFLKKLL